MKKNKKGIMVEFLLRLIIAILFLWGAIALGKSMFRVTSQAEQSFNNLYNLINEIEDEETLSMDLIMDRKTAIYGFSKDADQIIKPRIGNTPSGKCEDDYYCESFVKRPISCEEGKACICYCSKYEMDSSLQEFFGRQWGFELVCKKPICSSFDEINFLERIPEKNLAYYTDKIGLFRLEGTIYYGFIFERAKTDSGGLLTQINMPARYRGIYIQRYGDVVSVCADPPCISEEMINERIPITVDEFSEANFMFKDGWMIGVDNDGDETLETFYYIKEIVKDNFGSYYYQYKYGIRPTSAPEQADFLDVIQEKSKEDFESRFVDYAKEGRLVKIDYDNEKGDIKSFEAETGMDKEGKVINIGDVTEGG